MKLAKNTFVSMLPSVKPLKCISLISLFLVLMNSLIAVEITDTGGRQIEVDVLNIEEARIEIRMANGQTTWLDRSRLSEQSNAMISASAEQEKDAHKEFNQLLGIDLFADSHLWDDASGAVAKRLQWPQESQTDNQSSYRKYPRAEYRILESRPYSAVLYGEQGKAQNISIVFANKGDYKFSDPPTEGEIQNMERAIDHDVSQIEDLLTKQLGGAERQQYGSGRGIKQLIKRWDWKDHAFLLASQDGEYVTLKITTVTAANNKGRGEKLSDAVLRNLSVENIVTNDNGDVLISNIPMVNQGPKGYCVPATFERYLRYLQIPADMYILAMAGQTSVGGGTSLSNIIEAIKSYAASHNRSMKELKDEIEVRSVKKYIDKGLPLIWTMYSSPKYNDFVNERSKARADTDNWKAWKDRSKDEARSMNLVKDVFAAHACMIIGYNKDTAEIAVSDSWGPSFAVRWVPATQAEQVSQGTLHLIEF